MDTKTKLIYLYIADIKRNIENQGLSFSDEYKCEYNPKKNKLIINKNKDSCSIQYSKNIISIHAIVGKNGTGKSSIIRLLGLNKSDRNSCFLEIDEREHTGNIQWFAVYHVKNDLFVMEGSYPFFLFSEGVNSFTYLDSSEGFCIFEFCYSFSTGTIKSNTIKQLMYSYDDSCSNDRSSLFFLLYQDNAAHQWHDGISCDESFGQFDEGFVRYSCDYDIRRYHILGDLLFDLYKINKTSEDNVNRLFEELFPDLKKSLTLSVSVSLKSRFNSYELTDIIRNDNNYLGDELIKKLQFPKNNVSIKGQNNKQKFIIKYLENILLNILYYARLQFKYEPESFSSEANSYREQKEFLISKIGYFIEIYLQLKFFNPIAATYNSSYIEETPQKIINNLKKICEILEKLEDKFFISDTSVHINYESIDFNILEPFFLAFDNLNQNPHLRFLNLFAISFNGLSSGAIKILDLFSVLYEKIKSIKKSKIQTGATCVLLLDEPDLYFHLEWSRRFILGLTKFLQLNVFCEYNFQIIIATHSPFLLTDIEKENCICLSEENGTIKITHSNKAFLSRLDDLLVDTFFVDSIFGAFAERYADDIIKEINHYSDNPNDIDSKKILLLEKKVDKITNQLIKQSLFLKLNKLKLIRDRIHD